MRFSIIIPSYGQAKYLRDAITSALAQTYSPSDFEVIVVDDGSTDGSLAIAKEYSPRVRVIQQVNKGLASARNTGIMNAQGEYILPLDADDVLLPRALYAISETIDENLLDESPDVIGISIDCFDETTGGRQGTVLLENPTFGDFKEGNRLAYCAAIKRSVLLQVGGYSPRMDVLGGWEDLHLWYNLMHLGKKITVAWPSFPLLRYRLKENSMWKDAQKNEIKLWEQIVKDFPEAKDHVKFKYAKT